MPEEFFRGKMNTNKCKEASIPEGLLHNGYTDFDEMDPEVLYQLNQYKLG